MLVDLELSGTSVDGWQFDSVAAMVVRAGVTDFGRLVGKYIQLVDPLERGQ